MSTPARDSRRQIVGPAASIIAAQALAALVGYAFWMVVTRRASVQGTGLASSVISAASATALVFAVGIAYSQLPAAGGTSTRGVRRRDPALGLVATVVLSCLGGLCLIVASPWAVPGLAHAGTAVRLHVLAISVVTATGMYLDYLGIAAARSWIMVLRSVVAVVGRLGLIVVAGSGIGAPDVTLAWLVALVASLVPSSLALRGVVDWGDHGGGPVATRLRAQLRVWVGNHLTSVGGVTGPLVLPVIVLDVLGAHDAGLFYPTWMLGSMFFMLSPAVVGATLSRAVVDRRDERARFGFAARLTAVLVAGPLAVCLAAPGPLLGLFGADYAVHGPGLLRILAVSALPDAVSNLLVAVLRSRGRFGATMAVNTTITATTLLLAPALLTAYGITGGGWAWLAGQTLGCLVAGAALARGVPVPAHERVGTLDSDVTRAASGSRRAT